MKRNAREQAIAKILEVFDDEVSLNSARTRLRDERPRFRYLIGVFLGKKDLGVAEFINDKFGRAINGESGKGVNGESGKGVCFVEKITIKNLKIRALFFNVRTIGHHVDEFIGVLENNKNEIRIRAGIETKKEQWLRRYLENGVQNDPIERN